MMKAKTLVPTLAAAALALALAGPASAQSEIEIGALGLISDYTSLDVSNSARSGAVGPALGFSGGFILGQAMSDRWGGEFRYLYFRNDLELDAGSDSAELGAQSHAVHYDVLYYFKDPDVRVRPYVAAGIGLKYYQGTGTEDPFQPGNDLALLTRTNQSMFMGDVGVGVKFRVGRNATFRVEFRDYMTGVPTEVIAASPGADLQGGILHHWAPLFGITWTF